MAGGRVHDHRRRARQFVDEKPAALASSHIGEMRDPVELAKSS